MSTTTDAITIPAREGRAVMLRAGQAVKITNPHGNQVFDVWAFNADDPDEIMDMAHTRSCNSRIYVHRGDGLMTPRRRPILTIEADTSPGRHDILLCACNLWIYRELGVQGHHRNCAENLHEALGAIGRSLEHTPSPLNLFMNVPVTAEGALDRVPPLSKPGDYAVLRAHLNTVVAVSACPQDITAVNGGQPREGVMEVID